MKLLSPLLLLLTSVGVFGCDVKQEEFKLEVPTDWIDLKGLCLQAMRLQVQKEIEASYVYMAMAAHFSRDTVNRPGFSEIFFKASREEREHASNIMEYLSMRGQLTDEITNLIKVPKVEKHIWDNGASALKDALELETNVTRTIREMVKVCEDEKYYHLVDYLSGVFLEEQLQGQRELAGKLVTLKKMMGSHGALGEFLFDKELLIAAQRDGGHF